MKILIEETFLRTDHNKSEIKVIKRGQGTACTYSYEKKSFKQTYKVESGNEGSDVGDSEPTEAKPELTLMS